ncbi:MAG: DNA helicase [Leptolyngbya foveolarum]|uniref:DNA 3'-5' helicase n=1 Tax=Leptolyngbya foveolarum TaxID=47253 RepID=A0A2W4U2P5_9CYAN|nr:MAG: DNA helicase [Leptolyngbya foveolarum]
MSLQQNFRLAISDDFFDAYSRLPRKAQSKISEFINRFRQDPTRPGLNYESIQGSKDKNMKSVRIDQAHRAIVLKPDQGSVYLLLWVDKHDDAYNWAKRRTCLVNEVSGALQIVDIEDAAVTAEKLSQRNASSSTGRFEDIKDKHLMRLGVPEILLPALRQVVTDDDVEQILPHLPREASDAILMLAADYDLETVFRQLEKTQATQPVNPDDLETALQNDDSLSRFMVITDDTALDEMLAAPLEKWRVFLHPTQRKLVERDWNGPVRVLGGAGTGKTVVAMHRAKWLAQNRFTDSSDRILFTTFTKNLAVDIEANLRSICSPEQMRRIQVINLDAWVAEFLRQEGVDLRLAYGEDSRHEWEEAYTLAPTELGHPLSFYQEEWRDVVLSQSCQTLRDYLKARRVGRGTRLSRKQRQLLWPVFEEYRNLLREQGLREPDDAMQDVARMVEEKGADAFPYKAVIVDEAQDMSPAAFSLLRALAQPSRREITGNPDKNDLFIVGDAHQRIYGKVVTLSQCGIDIRGRARKLRLNYRTTDETRLWATAVLQGMAVDDLDGGTDSLKDYRSLMHGEEPFVRGFETFQTEVDYLRQVILDIQASESQSAGICLAVRTNALVEKYLAALKAENIPIKKIYRSQPDNPADGGVRIATMHRVKGLQFDYMLLPALGEENLPLALALTQCSDETAKQRFINSDRSLLHVAATRAKKRVFVTYCGEPSIFLGGN